MACAMNCARRARSSSPCTRATIDTDMVKSVEAPKAKPEDIARAVLAGIEAGAPEVLADDTARHVKAGFAATPSIYLG